MFAIIGRFVETFPDIHKRMVDEGHELINHTYNHPDNPHWAPDSYFNLLTTDEQRQEIEMCHEVVFKKTAFTMRGYRSPHFGNLHTNEVYDILAQLGYSYSSSVSLQYSKSYGEPYLEASGITEIPVGGSLNYPLAVFDSWNTLRKKNCFFKTDKQFLDEFDLTIKSLEKSCGYLTHYFDPYDLPSKKFSKMLDSLTTSDVKVVTYSELLD